MKMKPLTNAKVRLSGEDGNAFFILARVKKAILRSNKPELAEEFYKKATSGDYDNLLQTCMEYVEVE
jgi:hypothetical protein